MPFLILPNELHIVVSREGIEENSSPKKMMLLIIKTNKLLLLSNYINSKTKIPSNLIMKDGQIQLHIQYNVGT